MHVCLCAYTTFLTSLSLSLFLSSLLSLHPKPSTILLLCLSLYHICTYYNLIKQVGKWLFCIAIKNLEREIDLYRFRLYVYYTIYLYSAVGNIECFLTNLYVFIPYIHIFVIFSYGHYIYK